MLIFLMKISSVNWISSPIRLDLYLGSKVKTIFELYWLETSSL